MRWSPFNYDGCSFDLSHLHPRAVTYIQAAKDGKPSREYRVEVEFSSHCFTRGIGASEEQDGKLLFTHRGDERVFDFQRYELSFRLPALIDQLIERKCYHTGHGNFFVVELMDANGDKLQYEIYFTAYKPGRKRPVKLIVQSAYIREKDHNSERPRFKLINFYVILFNLLNGKPIKEPK